MADPGPARKPDGPASMEPVGPAPLIRTFSVYCRQRYGQPVGKIPVDLGAPCPNRLRGGCIYCRPASFTPAYLSPSEPPAIQIARGKKQLIRGRFTRYFAYFQQETCTALPVDRLLPIFGQLLADPPCVGLILSTRPDAVEQSLLTALTGLLRTTGKECLIELGLQSIHDRSLRLLNRNHDFAAFVDAAERIRAAGGIGLGAHLILGIPGENEAEMAATVQTVCRLGVEHLKLHHLQVIRDTPLARWYEAGRVPLFSPTAYLRLLLELLPLVPAEVTIHRLWATAHPELLVAPRWHRLASDLGQELRSALRALGVRQGQRAAGSAAFPEATVG